jgi:hypothetical protein
MMRTLRHPITMFIITVLIVIGVGVGIVAVTQTSKVYGPSWGQFTASFPGRMRVIYSPPVLSASFGDPLKYTTTFYYANQHFNGWVGYAPLTGVIFPTDLRAVVVTEVTRHVHGSGLATRQIAHPTGGYLSGARARQDKTVVNGLTVVDFAPRCGYGQCQAEIVVSNGRVLWDVLAASNGPASTVEAFLDSFQPIG